MAGMSNGGGGGYQAPVYQSGDPYAANYKPPTGPQGTPAGPITPPKSGVETEEDRRRRQALILGAYSEGLGDGGDGSGGAASAGGAAAGDGSASGEGAGSGTGGTY